MVHNRRMIVAESAGVPIHVDESIRSITFTDSPYYAHMHLSAVDIYPKCGDDLVPSPVAGRVIGIRTVKTPTPKYFDADEDEKLLLIANSARLATKILHLKPSVDIGETVEISSPLGKYVRRGFFNFWTDRHIHVEIRPKDDPIRARGSYPVIPRLLENHDSDEDEQADQSKITCDIAQLTPEYLLLKPPAQTLATLGGYVGVKVIVGKKRAGILDGGFPYYGTGGVLLMNDRNIKIGDEVWLGGATIGKIQSPPPGQDKPCPHYAIVKFKEGIRVQLSSHTLRGLALSMFVSSLHSVPLKAVPYHPYDKDELITFRDHEVLKIASYP